MLVGLLWWVISSLAMNLNDLPTSSTKIIHNRLTCHYFVRDNKQHRAINYGPADLWLKSDILKSPSQLRGYSVSIYQMHHLDGSLDMPLPNLSICYEVPLDLFDEHFEKQLTPAIMLWYTWRGLNGVLGIHATALENAGMIRIDLGAAYGSDLFNHVMHWIERFLSKLATSELLINAKRFVPKQNLLSGYEHLSPTQDEWSKINEPLILTIRHSHIISAINLKNGNWVNLFMKTLDLKKCHQRLAICLLSAWPVDFEARQLRIEIVLPENQALLLFMKAFEESQTENGQRIFKNVTALTLESPPITSQKSDIPNISISLLLSCKVPLALIDALADEIKILYSTLVFNGYLNEASKSFLQLPSKYLSNLDRRLTYKIEWFNELGSKAATIRSLSDFSALRSKNSFSTSVLTKSRIFLYQSGNLTVLKGFRELVAITAVFDPLHLSKVLLECDGLMSRNSVFRYIFSMLPSMFIIDGILTEEEKPKNSGRRHQRAVQSTSERKVASKIFFILPGTWKINHPSIEPLVVLFNGFLQTCGIQPKIVISKICPLDLSIGESFKPDGKFILAIREKSWLQSNQLMLPKDSDIKSAPSRVIPVSIKQLQEREALRKADLRKKAAALRKKAREAEASRIAAEEALRKISGTGPIIPVKTVETVLEKESNSGKDREKPALEVKEIEEIKEVEKKKQYIPKQKTEKKQKWAPKPKPEKKKKVLNIPPSFDATPSLSVGPNTSLEAKKVPTKYGKEIDSRGKTQKETSPEVNIILDKEVKRAEIEMGTVDNSGDSVDLAFPKNFSDQVDVSETEIMANGNTIIASAWPKATSHLVSTEEITTGTQYDSNLNVMAAQLKGSSPNDKSKYCPPIDKIPTDNTTSNRTPTEVELVPDELPVLPVDAVPIVIRSDYRVSGSLFSSVIRRPRLARTNLTSIN